MVREEQPCRPSDFNNCKFPMPAGSEIKEEQRFNRQLNTDDAKISLGTRGCLRRRRVHLLTYAARGCDTLTVQVGRGLTGTDLFDGLKRQGDAGRHDSKSCHVERQARPTKPPGAWEDASVEKDGVSHGAHRTKCTGRNGAANR